MWAHYFNTCRCATVLKLLLLSVTVIMLHLEIVGPQTVEWSLHQASVLMTSAVSHKCGLTQKKRRAQRRKLTMVLKFAELKILRHCCKPKGVKGPPIWYFHLFVFPVCKHLRHMQTVTRRVTLLLFQMTSSSHSTRGLCWKHSILRFRIFQI